VKSAGKPGGGGGAGHGHRDGLRETRQKGRKRNQEQNIQKKHRKPSEEHTKINSIDKGKDVKRLGVLRWKGKDFQAMICKSLGKSWVPVGFLKRLESSQGG